MRKNFLIVLVLAALLPAFAVAQVDIRGPYAAWTGEYQTRNIPAGTVADPGSHLTFIVDTGVNARNLDNDPATTDDNFPDLDVVEEAALHPLDEGSLIQPFLDANGDGELDPGAIYQNYIAVTNTHPTQAVTIHFRYFNDNCEDVLDFLVVVTCNDTLLFDPFDFIIPFTNGENSKWRVIGPAIEGKILQPILVHQWGSGRFVITASASATTIDLDSEPEILFPKEFAGLDDECNIQATGTTLGGTLADVLAGSVRNVGLNGGIRPDNLHVFNASQMSFNYLIGHITTAVMNAPGLDQISWAVPAWARPAVDRAFDSNFTPLTNESDGDAPHAETGRLLWGTEDGVDSDVQDAGEQGLFTNALYLRNEVHGGDIHGPDPFGANGGYSLYGALGTTPFHITDPEDQLFHFLSVADDYNGSNNQDVGFGVLIKDQSANISPAATTYALEIFDNNENMLGLTPGTVIPVSPPNIPAVGILKITCICLRTYFDFFNQQTNKVEFNGSRSMDDTSIGDLDFFTGGNVLVAVGDFDGLLDATSPFDIDSAAPRPSQDLSGGWIRFVRDNTDIVEIVPVDAGTAVDNASATGPGTSTFDDLQLADNSDAFGPSFLTIGEYVLKYQGFGAALYLHAVAANPASSGTPPAERDDAF